MVEELGARVLGFRVESLGFRVKGLVLRFEICGLGFMVQCLGLRAWRLRVQGSGFGVEG